MTHRLWFRLDDILPIAEHAMACQHHPPTGAQAAAVGPDGPALILTYTPAVDTASSNGYPRWYDHSGDQHVAHAHGWHQPATGRRGTPSWLRAGPAYLPLRDPDGNDVALIDLLRAARPLGGHWIAVTPDPADPRRCQVEGLTCRRDALVPDAARWRPRMVTQLGPWAQRYPALVAEGYTTGDGHPLVRFAATTVWRMAADLTAVVRAETMPGEYPILYPVDDAFLLLEEEDTGDTVRHVEVDRYRPDRDGLYAIGAYLMPWRVTDTPVPLADRLRLRLAAALGRWL